MARTAAPRTAAVEELGQGQLAELDPGLIPTLWLSDGGVAGTASRDETGAAGDPAIQGGLEPPQPE